MATKFDGRGKVRFVRPAAIPGLEVVTATYPGCSFPVHAHPEYVVGCVSEGAERLVVGSREWLVARGSSLFLHPGEAHSNSAPEGQTLTYRVFYIEADALARCGCQPSFREPVTACSSVYRQLRTMHGQLSRSEDPAAQRTAFARLVSLLDSRHERAAQAEAESERLRKAREYLDQHFAADIGLDRLAELSRLSTFHFVRSFRSGYGLSPIAYRNQRRVMEARRLLRDGLAIAEVAVAVGFGDQSHLTRQFRRVMGTTPGQYAQQERPIHGEA